MSLENLPDPSSPKPIRSIQIYQQKANFFRVVHADGVWCSVNAWRNLHMTFYSERYPIPTKVFFGIDDKGNVTGEDVEKREVKKDWFREMEVDVVLSLDSARQVQDALQRYIKVLEDLSNPATK